MRFTRILGGMAVAILAMGMSSGVAKADGDPRGATHTPGDPGTPYETSNVFSLAPFGSVDPTGVCSYSAQAGEEDCTLKNMSGANWTEISITLGGESSCSGITATSDLFLDSSCQVIQGAATLVFAGVEYSQGAQNFITTAAAIGAAGGLSGPIVQQELLTNQPGETAYLPLCGSTASGNTGGTPGVMAGCDVEFSFSGDGSGDWPIGTTFSVVAPEPGVTALLGLGLLAMMFVGSRFKTVKN